MTVREFNFLLSSLLIATGCTGQIVDTPWIDNTSNAASTNLSGQASSSGTSWREHTLNLEKGQTVDATLEWNTGANLNLFLYAPSGQLVARSNDLSNPEQIRYEVPISGEYRFGVKAKTGSATNYDLVLDVTEPEKLLEATAQGGKWITHPVVVVEGNQSIRAELTWTKRSENLNLFLLAPNGDTVASSNGLAHPESLVFDELYPGRWSLAIKHKTSQTTDYAIRYTMDGDDDGTPSEPEPQVPTVSGPLVPTSGVLFGSCGDFQESSGTYGSFRDREQQTGRQYDIFHGYHRFGDSLPKSQEVQMANEGRVLMLNWKPNSSQGQTWRRIANGEFNSVIRNTARDLKAFGQPMFLVFHHEMDTGHNQQNYGTPADYVAAYRRVHDVFGSEGVTNIIWTWNPTGWDPSRAKPFYPGNSYVDWIGFDLYNWSYCRGDGDRWTSFADVVRPAYTWAQDNYPTKPIVLPEWGAQENTRNGESRASWLNNVVPSIKAEFPALKALIYFDVDVNFQDAACQWQVDNSSSSLRAYTELANDDFTNVLHTASP